MTVQKKPSTERRQKFTKKRLSRCHGSKVKLNGLRKGARSKIPVDASRICRPTWPSFCLILIRAAFLARNHPLHLPVLSAQIRTRLRDSGPPGLQSTPLWRRAGVYSQENSPFLFTDPADLILEEQQCDNETGHVDMADVEDLCPRAESHRREAYRVSPRLEHTSDSVSSVDLSSGRGRWQKRIVRSRILIARVVRSLHLHCLSSIICCT